MKKLLAAIAVMSLCSTAFAAAPAAASAPTKQQSKMVTCNADAAGKKGDERKAFMKTCLSAAPAAEPAKPMTQQEKMKACNTEATGKKGDERKAFMKTCLSAPKA
ncbi:MAG: PsiF family protein [Massilia sp.]